MRLSILPLLLSVQVVLSQDGTNSAGDSRRVIDTKPAPVNAAGKVMRVGSKEFDFGKWKKAGQDDLRCGCPAMNSIANHGFINHNGRNLTVADVVPVMVDVFHLSEELATIVTNLAMLTADDPASGQFSLGMLNKHNIFEHDASMSRKDFYAGGDGFTFDRKTFDRFMSYFGNDEFIDLKKAAAARYDRVQQSRRDNPTFTYTSQQRITSYGEVIKFFRTLVDNKIGKTPVKFVKILFGRWIWLLRANPGISKIIPADIKIQRRNVSPSPRVGDVQTRRLVVSRSRATFWNWPSKPTRSQMGKTVPRQSTDVNSPRSAPSA